MCYIFGISSYFAFALGDFLGFLDFESGCCSFEGLIIIQPPTLIAA
jgi:hypothetical protein